MTVLTHLPWALNQDIPEGYGYSAEQLRAQHYASTSGGTGVDTPEALKVQAQPAPDGTVLVSPGGATAVSNYDGQYGQSYHAFYGAPQTIDIPPTGSSSGGRHDLIIQRFIDPDHEQYPGYEGTYPIPAEVAKDLRFKWIEVLEGRDWRTVLPYPAVKLAHIRRGPNRTIVEPADIIDLRKLANPQSDVHAAGNNLTREDAQSLHRGSEVWPEDATHYVTIPDYATQVTCIGKWNNARHHETAAIGAETYALVRMILIHPDGTELSTQESRFRTSIVMNRGFFQIGLSDTVSVPAKFRGETVRFEMRGNTISGANVYMDGDSSWDVQLHFKQGIS